MKKIPVEKHDFIGLHEYLDAKMGEGHVLSSIRGDEAEFMPASQRFYYFLSYGKASLDECARYDLSFIGKHGKIWIYVSKKQVDQDFSLLQQKAINAELVLLFLLFCFFAYFLLGRLRSFAVFLVNGAPASTWFMILGVVCMILCIIGMICLFLARTNNKLPLARLLGFSKAARLPTSC